MAKETTKTATKVAGTVAGTAGTGAPNNLYDIVCVYMVRYGYENVAIDMNETNKASLKSVFDDMCSYTTETTTKEVKNKTEKNA